MGFTLSSQGSKQHPTNATDLGVGDIAMTLAALAAVGKTTHEHTVGTHGVPGSRPWARYLFPTSGTYMSKGVEVVVGEFEFLEGNQLPHPVGTGGRGIGVHVQPPGHGRLCLPRHGPAWGQRH